MKTPQNICFFNTTLFWGGGEKWHFETATLCSQTNNNTFFVCHNKGLLAKKLEGQKIKKKHISVNNRSFLNPIKTYKLKTFFIENNIDTVIFNSPKDLKIGGIAAKKAGVKNIVYRRGIAVEVKNKTLNKKLFKDVVTHFVFNSQATKNLLEKNFKNIIETKKTAIIYNAIEFPANSNLNHTQNNDLFVIGSAGRFVEQKGQHLLVDLAENLIKHNRNFIIKVAGDGPLKEEVLNKIKNKNLTNHIQLLGFVEDMGDFMKSIDVLVSTALWEGFGFVLAEAMTYKKPVLAFNLSSNPELIKDGENGYLIEPTNIKLFSDKLLNLIDHPETRKYLGDNAYEFAKKNFEKEQQFQKLMEFIAL